MPGINAVLSGGALSPITKEASLKELIYKKGLIAAEYVSTREVLVAVSGYIGYPWQSYEDENTLTVVEGMIYNRGDAELHGALEAIAAAAGREGAYRDNVADLVARADGDFLAIIYLKKQKRLIIFNDRWGRLPTYYRYSPTLFALSRELKFLLPWEPEQRLNHQALAEWLSFEYSFGEKTFFESICRLPPATMLEAAVHEGNVALEKEVLFPVAFDSREVKGGQEEIVADLAAHFRRSLQRRIDYVSEKGMRIIADLSGGFDTRAVFLGLHRSGAEFVPACDHLATGDESAVAGELGQMYGREVSQFAAQYPPDFLKEMKRIGYVTDGLVNGETAVTCFYDDLARESTLAGPLARFMGFGGEFIRHPYRVMHPRGDLVSYLMKDAYTNFLPIEKACRLTGISENDFRRNLEMETGKFPEKDEDGRVRHLYFEYYNRVVNGGENRHRLFAWTVQPLWGRELFEYEMYHVGAGTVGYELYLEFLKALDERALEVPFYGIKGKLSDAPARQRFLSGLKWRQRLRDNYHARRVYRRIRPYFSKKDGSVEEKELIRKEIRDCYDKYMTVQRNLDGSSLGKMIAEKVSKRELYQILTLIHYLAEVEERFGK